MGFVVWQDLSLLSPMLAFIRFPCALLSFSPGGAIRGKTLALWMTVMVLARVATGAADGPKEFDPKGSNTNGLGMRFVTVPRTKAQFSVYQTRVKDFRAFVRETGYVHMRETPDPASRMWSLDLDGIKQRGHSWEDPGFAQSEDHPVVGVSWYDAKAFCEWLTLRERAAGRLPADWAYRLPADHEWSMAVGLIEEDPAQTPEEKNGQIKNRYFWGTEWPPPTGAGNYAGVEADDGHWPAVFGTILGYKDDYPRTAPVGSFKPNQFGLYDLGSNVSEWCEDKFRRGGDERALRGGSWYDLTRDYLIASNRLAALPDSRFVYIGFRCVAGAVSPKR
jgi:formylglycine-generating enzyme required for sulfatase activity